MSLVQSASEQHIGYFTSDMRKTKARDGNRPFLASYLGAPS